LWRVRRANFQGQPCHFWSCLLESGNTGKAKRQTCAMECITPVVDLTTSSVRLSDSDSPSHYVFEGPRRAGPSSFQLDHKLRAAKRQRSTTSPDKPSPSGTGGRQVSEAAVGSPDLIEVNDSSTLSRVLAKQREDAVKAQSHPEGRAGGSSLTSYKCPVCMDTPVDATTTICGLYQPLSLPPVR
jgi:hypothetical protein